MNNNKKVIYTIVCDLAGTMINNTSKDDDAMQQ